MNKTHKTDTPPSLIYGVHPIIETIRAGHRKIHEVFLVKGSESEKRLRSEFEILNLNIRFMSPLALDSLTRDPRNQGIAARVDPFTYCDFESDLSILKHKDRFAVLILDHIQDPNNLGNILRSACCFGIDLIILSKDRAASVTASVEKASAGSSAHVRVCRVVNLNRSIQNLKEIGSWVYGTDAKSGTNYFDVDLAGKITIVMGAEGSGMRRLVRENCDMMIKIPIIGNVPSLNVSNATTILFSETFRQVSFGSSDISGSL